MKIIKRKFRFLNDPFDTISNILVFLLSLIMLFPIYWLFSNSLMEGWAITVQPPRWFPNPVSFQGYIQLISRRPVALWM